MPRQYDYNPTEFSGITSLRNLAEREDLQADEKPVFATTFGDEGGDYRLSNEESSVRAHAVALDDYKVVYSRESGAVHDVVTDDYEVINPPEFIGPLCDQLTERERGDIMGTVYLRDDGGAAYAQLLFDETHSIYLPDRGRSNPVRCGFEMTWSHSSSKAINVRGFAQDTSCENSIREVTSPVHVKHSGDVGERVDWHEEWADVLDQMGAFSENLGDIIEESMEFHFWDLRDEDDDAAFPETWLEQTDPLDTLGSVAVPGPLDDRHRDGFHAFYELLGFPRYIASAAAERLLDTQREQDDPRVVTAWRAFSAATYALTSAYRGSQVNADDKFRTANEILLNPEQALMAAGDEAVSRAQPDDESGIMWEDSEPDEAETTGEALREYSEASRELRDSFSADDD